MSEERRSEGEEVSSETWRSLGAQLAAAARNVLGCEPLELSETLLRLEGALHAWEDQVARCQPDRGEKMRRCLKAVFARDAESAMIWRGTLRYQASQILPERLRIDGDYNLTVVAQVEAKTVMDSEAFTRAKARELCRAKITQLLEGEDPGCGKIPELGIEIAGLLDQAMTMEKIQ